MKKALIVKLSVAFAVAMSASTWAQEAQPSLSDSSVQGAVVQGSYAAEPIPGVVSAPIMGAPCGCAQTFTGYAPVGQVGYNQPIQQSAPIVNSAPIYQASTGCCGQTFQGQSYQGASYGTAIPAAPNFTTGQCCGTPAPAPCDSCNTCNTCPQQQSCCDPCGQQQRRGFFRGRRARRNMATTY